MCIDGLGDQPRDVCLGRENSPLLAVKFAIRNRAAEEGRR